jgi:hypothetical protein
MSPRKIAVTSLLCAAVALAACRREDVCCQPMKVVPSTVDEYNALFAPQSY